MNNKYLIVKKESIFHKIKSFFIRLFYTEKNTNEPVIENYSNIKTLNNKEAFAEKIKTNVDLEKISLLKTQKDFEDGKLLEENMSAEQVSKLENLYKEQITRLRNEYSSYKQKIVSIKQKNSYSNN